MSSDFDRVLVTDDRLGAITDKIRYAVVQGRGKMLPPPAFQRQLKVRHNFNSQCQCPHLRQWLTDKF